jgi:hypothetical protein
MASLKFAIDAGESSCARESSFHCMSPVVASRSFLGMPSASTLTRRPAPGLLRLGFRAGRSVCRKIMANRVTEQVSHAEADEGNGKAVC